MIRLAAGDRLVLATHNAGKLREIAELLAPYGLDTVSAAELGASEPEETGTSFGENAELKATVAASASGLLALADDSGLEVAALGGSPGIYSARWAGEDGDFGVAMERIWHELRERSVPEPWEARFVCVLALALPDGSCDRYEGVVEGHCVWPPRGGRGFGYDPMFVPGDGEETFGEMEPSRKDSISHRRMAFDRFVARALAASAGD